ncbi:hypothetical protein V5799_014143 [Amblyomma americanum]|uniref:Uncharacterized protein n=1 Tax=Amblyomma americanum TaxID=6943 RepID=A0AAQ4E444_AMBAM
MPNVRPREVKQLKKLWDNMKQKAKKELARLSRGVMGTGGGPPPKPVDERLAQIEAIVPHITTTAPNAFDSDRPRASADVSNIIASMVQGDARLDKSDGESTVIIQSEDGLSDATLLASPAPDISAAGPSTEDERLHEEFMRLNGQHAEKNILQFLNEHAEALYRKALKMKSASSVLKSYETACWGALKDDKKRYCFASAVLNFIPFLVKENPKRLFCQVKLDIAQED